MRSLLIDLDGVLYEDDKVIPGAAEVVAWLADAGIPFLFVTNTTSRPRHALVDKLKELGIPVEEDLILTPPIAASRWIVTHVPGPAALFVSAATKTDLAVPELDETAMEGAGSVVIGDLGEGWSYGRLNRAFRLLMAEPPPVLVALGMTRYWRASDGLRLDVAPFVKALEYASGRTAVVLGKPSLEFFLTAREMLGSGAAETVMVGDDIVSDVGGAQRAGMQGVLVQTGKFRRQDLDGDIRPDAVLGSIAELPGWWKSTAAASAERQS
jgi:phospholysine phosphohistidine inorganic pyrophosphate phosphatase